MMPDVQSTKVLIIDDDEKLLGLLRDYFPRFQIEAITAANAAAGLLLLESAKPDLVILDVMMPGLDGFETCRAIRLRWATPIIMLSARGEAMDRIVRLELGADDYMAKPFEPRELVTRVKTILRRTGKAPEPADPPTSLHFGELEIRAAEREAWLDGLSLQLTSMEFELLYLLASQPGRKFSRDEIQNHIQGMDSGSYSRSVDILISRLRAKLGEDARTPRWIKSSHGFGYVFTGIAP